MRRQALLALCVTLVIGVCGCRGETAKTRRTLCISEVQSAGGEHDWVELYNYGTDTISLNGWYLSDDPETLGKSPLPTITLAAGERVVLTTDATAAHTLNFRLRAAGDTVLLISPEGNTVQTLTVPAAVAGLSYGCVEGDAYPPTDFVWYAAPTPNESNKHGLQLGSNATAAEFGVRINECVTRNRSSLYDSVGDYGDWIELYNTAEHAVDISGWMLTDSENAAERWAFPNRTTLPAGGYLVVFCDGKNTVTDGEYHTDFKLGEDDGFVALYAADGHFVSGIACQYGDADTTYGCNSEGTVVSLRYPTPAMPNAAEVTK